MPQCSITFTISNISVATVDDGGLIEAITPGVATVTGYAQASDPTTGHMITYSHDTVHVRVLKLTGIKIFVPSMHLLSGVEVGEYRYNIFHYSFIDNFHKWILFSWSFSLITALSARNCYM